MLTLATDDGSLVFVVWLDGEARFDFDEWGRSVELFDDFVEDDFDSPVLESCFDEEAERALECLSFDECRDESLCD